jgi:hypothetical protein
MLPLSGLFPDTPQAYGARRNVSDSFALAGGALARMLEVDGQPREVWIQSSSGKGLFKKLELIVGFYEDATSTRALIGSSIVFSAEAVLIVREGDLPRRPLVNEIIHIPKNTVWQIVECSLVRAFYQIALNRASTS